MSRHDGDIRFHHMLDQAGVGSIEGVRILNVTGAIPPELWNKVGIRIIPKLRSSQAEPLLAINFALEIKGEQAARLVRELKQAVDDLGLSGQVAIELK